MSTYNFWLSPVIYSFFSLILRFIACVPTFIISDLLKEFIWLSEARADSEFEGSVVPSDNNGTYFSDFWVKNSV